MGGDENTPPLINLILSCINNQSLLWFWWRQPRWMWPKGIPVPAIIWLYQIRHTFIISISQKCRFSLSVIKMVIIIIIIIIIVKIERWLDLPAWPPWPDCAAADPFNAHLCCFHLICHHHHCHQQWGKSWWWWLPNRKRRKREWHGALAEPLCICIKQEPPSHSCTFQ